MALTTVNITGTFNFPDATWSQYTKAEFHLSGYDTDTDVVVPQVTTVALGALGELSVNLWGNDDGLRGTVYRVNVVVYEDSGYSREVLRRDLGRIQIAGDGPIDIATLLDVPVTVTGVWYTFLSEDQYDAAIAAANAKDGAEAARDLAEAYATDAGVSETNAATSENNALIYAQASGAPILSTIADGRAAVLDGETFMVITETGVAVYTRDSATTETFIGWLTGYDGSSSTKYIDVGRFNTGTDLLAGFNAAMVTAIAGATIKFPARDYVLTDVLHNDTLDNLTLEFANGSTIAVSDGGSWATVEIDDTKAGMPQMKCAICYDGVTGGGVKGAVLDCADFSFEDFQTGLSGIYTRESTDVTHDFSHVKNVWPSTFLDTDYGPEGNVRFTGFLFTHCERGGTNFCKANHCKYDGFSTRMANKDVKHMFPQAWDCYEGAQASDRYAEILPAEINRGTVIQGGRFWDNNAQGIVFHATEVQCLDNIIDIPNTFVNRFPTVPTGGIRPITSDGSRIEGNVVRGVPGLTSDQLELIPHIAYQVGDTARIIFARNRAYDVHIAYRDEDTTFRGEYANNQFIRVNYGYVQTQLSTRDRNSIYTGGLIEAYICAMAIADRGTRIRDMNMTKLAGYTGSDAIIGINLDPNNDGNSTSRVVVSGSWPVNFTTPVKAGTSVSNYFESDNGVNFAGDSTYNTGTITVPNGVTFASVSHRLDRTPLNGEVQITQLTGAPVPFRTSWTNASVFVSLGSNAVDNPTFGYSIQARGYQRP